MAIQRVKTENEAYRVYWRNPITGKQQSRYTKSLFEAQKLDSEIKYRIKYDRDSFLKDLSSDIELITVDRLLLMYIKSLKTSLKNKQMYIYHVKDICSKIGEIPISELTTKQVRAVANDLDSAGLKSNTINRRLSILKAAYSWALTQELIEVNQLSKFTVPRGPDAKFQPPSPEEIKKIIMVAPEHLYRAVVLAYHLGIRFGESELFLLQWNNVDMTRKKITVVSSRKNPNEPFRVLDLRDDLASEMVK